LGGVIQNSFLRRFHLPLRIHVECYLARQQRSPYLGQSPIRQVYVSSLFSIFSFSIFTLTAFNNTHYRGINPAENRVVAFLTSGEGWHNYHHVFPWDYKAAELGNYNMNSTKAVIDFFAWIGWAYDLKTVPERIIFSRARRTGDGSHPFALEDSQYTMDDMKTEEEPFCEIIPEEKEN
jgi:stearoyl-CoA desaturase (delta-9 desaturase)